MSTVRHDDLAGRASATADRIAEMLAVPSPIEDDSLRWRTQSLSRGAAGVSLLHAARAHAGTGNWDRVHAWLKAATFAPLEAGPGAGLWFGAPAVAFALATVAPHVQYERALQLLDKVVAETVAARLEAAEARIEARRRPARTEYDLVSGLTGLGAHLLRRDPDGDQLRQLLNYLVQLTFPVEADDMAGTEVPGWWTHDIPGGRSPADFPHGHADLGMAHGIAGPLALMALAARDGVIVDGQAEAMDRICCWLEAWQQAGMSGSWWPERIVLAAHRDGSVLSGPTRPSWCYGTPGIARAMQLAAHALNAREWLLLADRAILNSLSDPRQLVRIIDPGLCHGWAGLAATVRVAATDASTSAIADHLTGLLTALINTAEHCAADGLIDGRAGAALILHSMTATTIPGWETCLLIN
ncbi:lanthionine synthetase C family protein [Rhizohabitans arisaemae]|uniref:lanthionine synthetase C family protein n=1 Tax=Rhizohabitans arisaemae TaxID=2720610 RepID=UPI0024B15F2A|nr:lanthionine synthetase C family protein [Rhizohabitans arisaemae]